MLEQNVLTSLLSSCEAHSYSRLTSTTASFSELSRFGPSGFSRQTWMSKWTCKNITVNRNLVPFNDKYMSCFSFKANFPMIVPNKEDKNYIFFSIKSTLRLYSDSISLQSGSKISVGPFTMKVQITEKWNKSI